MKKEKIVSEKENRKKENGRQGREKENWNKEEIK